MNRKNEIMTLKGFNTTSANPTDLQQEQPFSDCTTAEHFGMPITPAVFCEMLSAFRNSPAAGDDTFKNLWWVEFSKASIFRVLAQEECDYVRFYFVIPDPEKKKASLSLQGINSKRETIKRDVIVEASKKMADSAYIINNQLDETALLDSLASKPPAIEEKGNGGAGSSLLGDGNVKSINDFYKWQKDNGKHNITSIYPNSFIKFHNMR